MASWASSVRSVRARLRRSERSITDLRRRVVDAEEVVEVAQRDAHFRLSALEDAKGVAPRT